MAALTRSTSRRYTTVYHQGIDEKPVSANVTVYGGGALGVDGSGGVRPISGGSYRFAGFAEADGLNASGALGAVRVSVRTQGMAELSVVGVTGQANAGATVYASSDNDFTLTAAPGNVPIGNVVQHITGTTVLVFFRAVELETVVGGVKAPFAAVHRARFTVAEVNAGATILPAPGAGRRIRVHDMALIAIGGAAAGATSVDIIGTQSDVQVKLMSGLVAGLTHNALLRAGAPTNGVILAGGASFVANDADTPITIGKTGGSLSTATHIDVHLTYEII